MAVQLGRSMTDSSAVLQAMEEEGPHRTSFGEDKKRAAFQHNHKTVSFMDRFKGKARLEYEHMAASMSKSANSEITAELTEWSSWRAKMYSVLNSPVYSVTMGIVILMNAAMVILETDQKAYGAEVSPWISIVSVVFLGIYGVEIITRFYVFRLGFFRSGWNILDLFVVVTDTCLEISKIWYDNEVPSVSVLRIFRLARLIRLIAMLTIFQELQTMLLGFGSAMRAIFWASFMISIVLTVCSIVAVELIHPLNVEVASTGAYGNCNRCGRAFESVMESNLTFIQQIVAGDSWGLVTIPIIEAYPLSGIFFLIVFGLIDLGLLNLILTVIVNAAEAARIANKDMLLREKAAQTERMKQDLISLCGALDNDKDGRITKEEFLNGVDENDDFRKTLALLDIQRQDSEIIYHLMDEDESGDVDFNEFINAMITTKFESLNTRLLFLKANIHDILLKCKEQDQLLRHEVLSKLKASPDLAEAVNSAVKDGLAQLQFEGLEHKLDYRWQQLQAQQEQSCQMMEKVLTELSRGPQFHRPSPMPGTLEVRPTQEGNFRKSALPSICMPPSSCRRCEVADKDVATLHATYYTPERREQMPEKGLASPQKFISPRSPLVLGTNGSYG